MGLMLVLASQSPRRKELLERAGFEIVVRPSHIPEERLEGESPKEYVWRLAEEKARAVERASGEVVLAADTVVVIDDIILEKPHDDEDSARMLRQLSGRKHLVLTGISIVHDGGQHTSYAQTEVEFAHLSDEEIAEYVASGEPRDKAGAYGIQGRASKFVRGLSGCYFNIVGLPVSLVYRELRRLGMDRRTPRSAH